MTAIDATLITQIAFAAHSEAATAYGRKGDGVAAPGEAFGTLDIDDLTGGSFNLWTAATDQIYVGCTVTFPFVGFRCKTPGVYGTMSLWYSITSTAYDIHEANPDHTILLLTDLTAKFKDGYQFTIHDSAGNDGVYTCDGDSTWDAAHTTITTVETLPDGTNNGHIEAHTIWAPLTAVHNSTVGFTVSGYVAWVIPGTWGLSTVDSVSAYWIKAKVATYTTTAVAYNLLRSVTLNAPLHMLPTRATPAIGRDINGDTFRRDIPQQGTDRLTIDCTQIAASMASVHELWDWSHYRTRLYIQSGAHTVPIGTGAWSTDAYAHAYKGRIVTMPPGISTPHAMDTNLRYQLEIEVDEIETLTSRLGVAV